MRLQYIGRPKTFRDLDTGSLVSDLDSIHRADATEGMDGDFGYDDFDEFGDDDDDIGDDDSDDDSSDDDDSDDDDEIGATRGQRRRRARRTARKARRVAKRAAKKSRSGSKPPMQKTALAGSGTNAAAGAVSISIVPAHPFKAKDIVFNGSSANATVTSIMFGDNLIWNNAAGIDVSVLSTSSFIRGLIEGAVAHPGVPITINGTVAVGGDVLKATLFGYKPGRVC